jgi:F420-0:gamma-glutamyl ligase
MTQDEIIEMARQAGFDCYGKHITWDDVICTDELKAFAKLVAAKEREKWSEVEAYLIAASEGSMSRNNSEALAGELLIAIRARGQA